MSGQIIIFNGNVISMNESNENEQKNEWIVIKGDKIDNIGFGTSYERYITDNSVMLNARGGTILPGFIDSHVHVVQTALNAKSINLTNARSFDDIDKIVSDFREKHNYSQLRCIGLDIQNLKEKRFPTRIELDKICRDIPFWINSNDYHISMLNTNAFLFFKIPYTASGMDIDEKGLPTGIVRKAANAILRGNILKQITEKQRMETVTEIIPKFLKKGITTINAMEGGTMYCEEDAMFVYNCSKDFPVDMVLFNQIMDVKKIRTMNLHRLGGSLYIDGTIGARTAALSFEYNDSKGKMGGIVLTQQEIDDFVLSCYENNLQLALHTIGDRAVDAALSAHQKAFWKTGNKSLRHRLEHVVLASEEHIKIANELGVIFSVQPAYQAYWGGKNNMYNIRLGEKYKMTHSFRKMIEGGICVCAGSDSDVTPADPLLGIHWIVNHPIKESRLSIREAIKLYTYNGAYSIFEETEKGSIEKGKLADVVILKEDIEKVDKNKIKDIEVLATIKSGEILFHNEK